MQQMTLTSRLRAMLPIMTAGTGLPILLSRGPAARLVPCGDHPRLRWKRSSGRVIGMPNLRSRARARSLRFDSADLARPNIAGPRSGARADTYARIRRITRPLYLSLRIRSRRDRRSPIFATRVTASVIIVCNGDRYSRKIRVENCRSENNNGRIRTGVPASRESKGSLRILSVLIFAPRRRANSGFRAESIGADRELSLVLRARARR